MNNLYRDCLMKLRIKQPKQPKGELCPNCGRVRQFHHIKSNWVRPDTTIILNNHYSVLVCSGCGHRVYPAEMLQEYEDLKRRKVLV
jgi:YgiT-type zinc finger domain-containing protein